MNNSKGSSRKSYRKEVSSFKLCLAPISDFSHAPFRELVAGLGGCDIFFTEMLNSRILANGNIENDPYLGRANKDFPLFAQIAGKDPDTIVKALRRIKDMFEGFNINMGCARGKVQRFGWGVNLMADIGLASSIIRKSRRIISFQSQLTVKLRSGVHEHNISYLKEFCLMLEQEGVDAIILHPRTGKEKFSKRANWDEIAEIKDTVSIPVIGNGDVFGPEEAKKMLKITGCDGIMIGRSALIRPWIFRDIKAFIRQDKISRSPNLIYVIEDFFRNLLLYSPPELIKKRFLNFCFWFLQNWNFGLSWYAQIKRAGNMFDRAKEILAANPTIRPYPITPFMTK